MSVEDVYKDLKAKLLSIRRDLSLNPGSVVNDIFLTPQAYIIDKNRILLDYNKALQTFIDILAIKNDSNTISKIAEVQNKTPSQVLADISDFIDKKAADYDMTRNMATFATGYVYFGRFDAPSFDITIPAGTEVKTLDGKTYKTTESVIMYASGTDYYDPDENLYLIKAPVIATVSGSIGNTASYTINILVNQISGINYVLNKDNITNGLDIETDEAFISRIKSKLSGINTATEDGLKNLILANFPSIKDIYVVDTNNPLMIRDEGIGGKVDVYVLEESDPILVNEQYTQFNTIYSNYPAFLLNKEPVFFDGSEEIIGISPINYVFVKSQSSVLDNSKFEPSLVYITNLALTPPFNVKYKYFKICEDIQNFLNLPQNKILGSTDGSIYPADITILIKKAKQRNLDISFKVNIKIGFDSTITINKIRTAIANFVNSTLLKAKISQSDITNVVENIDGVDYVDWTDGIFDLDGGTNLNVSITVSVIEYMRLGTLNITTV